MLTTFVALAAATLDYPETITVTATRTPKPAASVGQSLTVLDADAVRASQEPILSDLLATTPGVTVSRNGGIGTATSLRIRGAEADQTVVLIDGVKLNDPSSTGGGFNFANLLAANVERVEILRGPQSTLWGSQAIGGVVSITSAEPEQPLETELRFEGGSRATGYGTAYLGSRRDRLSYALGGGYFETNGISAFDRRLGGRERDGYRHYGGYAKLRYELSDAISVDVRGFFSHGRTGIDGFPAPRFALADTPEVARTREAIGYAGLNVVMLEGRFRQRFGVAYTGTDRDNLNPGLDVPRTFDARGENRRWEYQGSLDVRRGVELVFGAETERSELSTASPTAADPSPRPLVADVRIDSGYAVVNLAPTDGLALSAGIRRDDQSNFRGATTRSGSVAYLLPGHGTRLRASFGEGFKAPTLFQLFSNFGNRRLEPETADGWDLGIDQSLVGATLRFSATYFSRRTRNQIDFVSCTRNPDPRCKAQPGGLYDNISRTRASGVELALLMRPLDRLRVEANYTFTDAESRSDGPNLGRLLPRRARDTANATLGYEPAPGVDLSATISLVGDSFDNLANSVRLDGYVLVDLRARYRLSPRVELFGRVENAFDASYQTVFRYGQPGRGAFAGMRTSF